MKRLSLIIVGIAVLVLSFTGTLYFLESPERRSFDFGFLDLRSFDVQRAAHARQIKAALERYRAARGKYPAPYKDNELLDLRPDLIGGGFITALPIDPYWKNGRVNKYRYRSDGATYGLLFYLELGPCQTGVGPLSQVAWDGRDVTGCSF